MIDDTPDTRDDIAGQIGEGGTEVPEGTGQDTSDGQDADDQDDAEDQDDANPNHREARYRVQRNEARAERDEARQQRDEAREQVSALCQSIIDQIASAAGLLDPSLLAREGHDLDSLLGEDGVPDAAKVREACGEVIKRHNIATKRVLAPNPQQGSFGQPSAQRVSEAWTGAFAPRRR